MAKWTPGKKGKHSTDMARFVKILDEDTRAAIAEAERITKETGTETKPVPKLSFVDVHEKRVDTPPRELFKRAEAAIAGRDDLTVYIDEQTEDENAEDFGKFTIRFERVEAEAETDEDGNGNDEDDTNGNDTPNA